jgi:hypothetical protein
VKNIKKNLYKQIKFENDDKDSNSKLKKLPLNFVLIFLFLILNYEQLN